VRYVFLSVLFIVAWIVIRGGVKDLWRTDNRARKAGL